MKPTSIKTVQRGHRFADLNYYEAIFPGSPDRDDISMAQRDHGFDPGGYGGPSCIQVEVQLDGTCLVRWSSHATCD
jgi:hypothetical protein